MRRALWIACLLAAATLMADGRDTLLWRGISNAGILYRDGQRDSAMSIVTRLLPEATQQGDFMAQTMLTLMTATAHSELGDKAAALRTFEKAARIAEDHQVMKEVVGRAAYGFVFMTMIPSYAQMSLLCDEAGDSAGSRRYAAKGMEWIAASGTPQSYAFPGSIMTEMLVKYGAKVIVRTDTAATDSAAAVRPPSAADMATAGIAATDSSATVPPPVPSVADNADEQAPGNTTGIGSTPTAAGPMTEADTTAWATAAAVMLTILICITIWQRRKRRHLEQQARQQIDDSYREGQEQERSRLARELHDGISNQLLAVEMKLKDEGRLSPQALQMLDESRQQVRRVSHELLPPAFEHTTLCEVLQDYADEMDGVGGCHVSYISTTPQNYVNDMPPTTALELYRIAQEAVGNAMKHGRATTVSIGLSRQEDGRLTLIISDDGRHHGLAPKGGIGLRTMQQRSATIGATIEQTTLPYGHTVKIVIG